MKNNLLRLVVVPCALFAALVHILKTPDHFSTAPWLGVLFVLDSAAFLALAIWILLRPSRIAELIVGLLGVGTAAGYVISRTIGLPAIARLPWDTLGVAVSVVEAILAFVVAAGLRTHAEAGATSEQRRVA